MEKQSVSSSKGLYQDAPPLLDSQEMIERRLVVADLIVIQAINQTKRRKRLIKMLAVSIILTLEIVANYNKNQSSLPIGYRRPSLAATSLWQTVVLVDANSDVYAEASVESPIVDALEDDDEDDEELNASASNEYPDGENDNDESYEDGDDDRQESRITEQWIRLINRTQRSDPESGT